MKRPVPKNTNTIGIRRASTQIPFDTSHAPQNLESPTLTGDSPCSALSSAPRSPTRRAGMAAPGSLDALGFEAVKQHAGPTTVARCVKVMAPGKFFPGLVGAEIAADYEVTALEFQERHAFARHAKGWGAAHNGPGIRFVSTSDAIDDPDHRGFWVTLALWNKWRHATYIAKGVEEPLEYLDALPRAASGPAAAAPEAKKPAVFEHFTLHFEGVHTYGGQGAMAGKQDKAFFFLCNKKGCARSCAERPIKQVGKGSGQLFVHLDTCNPVLATKLRNASAHSSTYTNEEGEV